MKKTKPFVLMIELSCPACRVNGFLVLSLPRTCPKCKAALTKPDREFPQTLDFHIRLTPEHQRRFVPGSVAVAVKRRRRDPKLLDAPVLKGVS